jgi:hypothetical protein
MHRTDDEACGGEEPRHVFLLLLLPEDSVDIETAFFCHGATVYRKDGMLGCVIVQGFASF